MSAPSIFSRKKANAVPTKGAPSPTPLAKEMPPPTSKMAPTQAAAAATEPPTKRQKMAGKKHAPSSLNKVARHFADIGDTNVSEDELKAWRAKSQEEKDAFVLKASCELLVHHMDKEEERLAHSVALKRAEDEAEKLKKTVKSRDRELKDAVEGWKKSEEALSTERTRLHGLEVELSTLQGSYTSLESENALLRRKEAEWASEKEKVEDVAFEEGLNSYIATFLAGAPSYDWTPSFGAGMAKFMAEFQAQQVELIASKKAELEKTLADEASKSQDGGEEARLKDASTSTPQDKEKEADEAV